MHATFQEFKKYSLTLENVFWLIEYAVTKHRRTQNSDKFCYLKTSTKTQQWKCKDVISDALL